MEDNRPLRNAMIRFLAGEGYAVAGAEDGAVGLRCWREQGADLVITDIEMPNKNGIEVVLELRAHAPGLPVIAISGGDRSVQLGLLGGALHIGAFGVLVKPFTLAELLDAVRDSLGRPHPARGPTDRR
ncbi:MAG TPA: response regulator [Gemmatimonadales bacterium]|nr:response regulator [Gemmatimonadales bacterium]